MRTTTRPLYTLVLCGAMLGGFLPTLAHSQGFRYTTTTRFSLAGTTGEAVSAVAGLADLNESTQTYAVLDEVMRVEQGDRVTLYDLAARRIVTMEGEACTVTTFDHLQQQAAEATSTASAEQGTDTGATNYDLSEVAFDFSVQPGGEVEEVSGYRLYPTTFTIMAETGGGGVTDALDGTTVLVSDVGLAQNVEGYEVVQHFQQRLAQELGFGFADRERAKKMQQVQRQDSRMQRVLEIALEEQIQLEGVPLKTTTYYVFVPAALTYDPSAVRPQKTTKKKKVGRFLRKATNKALGRAEETDEPRQRTLLIVSSTMDNLYYGPLDAALFEAVPVCGLAQAGQ